MIRPSKIIAHLKSKKSSNRALVIIVIWLLMALFSEFIANEKPIFIKSNQSYSWPIFESLFAKFMQKPYSYDESKFVDAHFVVRAPIPYSYHSIDKNNTNYVGPWAKQEVKAWRYRHWLGTDQLGRDVLAGMIHGAKISAVIGLIAMLIAGSLGLIIGLISGYFGNRLWKVNWWSFLLSGLFLIVSGYLIYYGIRLNALMNGLVMVAGLFFFCSAFIWILNKFLSVSKVFVPVDGISLKVIEILRSLPNLFLLLALLPLFRRPSASHIFIILGLVGWPTIALLIRAETLKIRKENFVKSAQVLGLSHIQIIRKHILPNVLGPFWVSIAFGISSVILAESTLSFLGIGIPLDQVTWGSMLNGARSYFKAWWLVLFPGIAIFMIILSFNIIGDRMQERIR